jgi:HAD superfamily hydrolase (TIGR01509 family)
MSAVSSMGRMRSGGNGNGSRQHIRALILDLDDTLYPEAQYVASGFVAVSEEASRLGLAEAHTFLALCQQAAAQPEHRGRVFNQVLALLGADGAPGTIDLLVDAYHRHWPQITPYHEVTEVLERLHRSLRLSILTDGHRVAQATKVKALGLELLVHAVVINDAPARFKPHPDGFTEALHRLGAEPEHTLMVGDQDKDILGALRMQIRPVRIDRSGSGLAEDIFGAPVISDLRALDRHLRIG